MASYDWFGSLAGQPVGMALVGPVALAIGSRPTLIGAWVLIAAANLTVLSLPSVRSVESAAARGGEPAVQALDT